METLDTIESNAMALSAQQRATLASHLLASLPPVLAEKDGGLSEALKRDAELDNDPANGMTMDQFKASMRR